jgi:hypothetical protein
MHENLLRESHKPYVLRTQSHDFRYYTGKRILEAAPLWLQKHADLRAHDSAHPPDLWHQPRLANVTCAWRWNLCGNNPAIGLYTRRPTVNWTCKEAPFMKTGEVHPKHWTVCSASCSDDFIPRKDSSISTAQEAGWTPELVFHSAAQTDIRFGYKNLQQSLRNLFSDCGIYGHRNGTSGLQLIMFS